MFDGIKAFFSKASKNSSLSSRFVARYAQPPARNTANWIKAYNLSPRMNPIHQIASDIASAEYEIRVKDKVIEDHALQALLDKPCDDISITRANLLYLTAVYLLLPMGEAFWLKERNGVGIPTQLFPIPPNWVSSIPTKSQPFFWVTPTGNTNLDQIPVLPEDMIYFKKPDIINPYLRGMGRANAIGDEIETDEYMAKFNKKFFFNDAVPSAVGMAPGADEPTLDRVRESWQQQYGGYNNSHKMAWLGWDAKIQILKESMKDMDFIESRKYLRDVTNQHFSIPPEIFGILENSNRSTIDSAYYLYAKNVLRKELNFIADVINKQLLPDFGDLAKLKFINVVPEDEEFKLKRANEGFSKGTMTVDEWRVTNNLEELPGGKGKVLYVPSGVIPVDLKGKSIIEELQNNKPQPLPVSNPSVEDDDMEEGKEEESSKKLKPYLEG